MIPLKMIRQREEGGAIFHSIDSAIHQIVIHFGFGVIMAATRRRSIHL
jgi:hypothetical protein